MAAFFDLLKAIVGSGAITPPPAPTVALDFTKATNSQYLALRSAGGL